LLGNDRLRLLGELLWIASELGRRPCGAWWHSRWDGAAPFTRRGCATALDPADDSDQSGADFEAVFPAPRPNSVPPSEHTCGGELSGTAGPAPDGDHAPQTTLRRRPPKRSHDRTPTFRFAASEARAHFECRVDRERFRSCTSPFTTGRLTFGPHRFLVRAVGHDGAKDPTPAIYRFRVVAPQR
jgi:hypothetical protein